MTQLRHDMPAAPTVHGAHQSAVEGDPVAPEQVLAALRALGYDFFTGVPCSLVSGMIAALEADSDTTYYAETREDAAIGLACGAMMAGRKPVVIMQNSGLGVCINALTSLTLLYKTPALLLITWRGYQGNDAPEHIIMGEVCGRLLETIGVPYRAPEPATLLDDLKWATAYQQEHSLPAALLLRPGVTR
jgi:sulfopyruvate decarboxylase subunit alpha